MPHTEVGSYPWQSDTVYAVELDEAGTIQRANPALREARGDELEGTRFDDLIAVEQRRSFARRLAEVGSDWERATLGFIDERGVGAEDRRVWLRRLPDRHVELVAEPPWNERDRLVAQVLALNDDLIASQRTVARRQRDLEQAQDEAARAALRVRRLEAILLAGLTPRDFDDALASLLSTAQDLLPGDRAEILLLDETGGRLVVRASAGERAVQEDRRPIPVGEGVLGTVAAHATSVLVADERAARRLGGPIPEGSLIAVPLRLEDEVIGVLAVGAAAGDCFSEPDLRLLELVGERVALAIGQAQLRERERRLAETLQRTLLPQSLPEVAGLDVAARYVPHAASVGGDFYDALALPSGALGVAIGDVTGKGLRAAVAMGRLRSALHAYALDRSRPGDVLLRLGRLADADGAMATALYLVLDPRSGGLELASAGHLPPLRVDDGHAEFLAVGDALSPPLGWSVQARRQTWLQLPVGSTLVLSTDGLVGRTHNLADGMSRLAAPAAAAPRGSVEDLCEHLVASLAPQGRYRDDVAVLAVRRKA